MILRGISVYLSGVPTGEPTLFSTKQKRPGKFAPYSESFNITAGIRKIRRKQGVDKTQFPALLAPGKTLLVHCACFGNNIEVSAGSPTVYVEMSGRSILFLQTAEPAPFT